MDWGVRGQLRHAGTHREHGARTWYSSSSSREMALCVPPIVPRRPPASHNNEPPLALPAVETAAPRGPCLALLLRVVVPAVAAAWVQSAGGGRERACQLRDRVG